MGHGEPASAICAVIKVLVAMELRLLPPNLHYNIPNPDIPALVDGRLSVNIYIIKIIVSLMYIKINYC